MNRDQLIDKLASFGLDPGELQTHEGCLAEMCRLCSTIGPQSLDWDNEPDPGIPDSPQEARKYAERSAKIARYAEKLRGEANRVLNFIPAGDTGSYAAGEDPFPGVNTVHPRGGRGPSGSYISPDPIPSVRGVASYEDQRSASRGLDGPTEGVRRMSDHEALSLVDKFCEERSLGDEDRESFWSAWQGMKKAKGSAADVRELLTV